MRYAIIADIHANLEALTAVLAAARDLRADSIICLGDIVGFHANPQECIDLVRQHASVCVRGNHDSVAAGLAEPDDFVPAARHAILWTRKVLDGPHTAWLRSLPLLAGVDGHFTIVHAALHPEPNDHERIRTAEDARPSLDMLARGAVPHRICFAGHTHNPTTYIMRDNEVSRSNDAIILLSPNAYYLINPGSIGQPRDGDPRASLATYDTATQTVQFHRVPYDRPAALAKAASAGLLPKRPLLRRSAAWLKHALLSSDL